MVSFAHIADVHLGYRQYGLELRREDYRRSFEQAVNRIIEEDVEFVLLAGDLFHPRDVEAETLEAAEEQLERLNENDIEVIAVEGNHDAALYRKELSWMEYLHKKGLLTLLSADFGEGRVFRPSSESDEGAIPGYVDRNGIRIFGVQYLGQRFSERIPQIVGGIKKVNEGNSPKSTVLVAHFGLSGQIPNAPGVPPERARKLGEVADYIALGHFHKRFEAGPIHNPGSLEAGSKRQAKWGHGFYAVDASDGGFSAEHIESERRPYCLLSYDVADYADPGAVKKDFEEMLESEVVPASRSPIVSLTLTGELGFSRNQLDLDSFEKTIAEYANPAHVVLNDATSTKVVSSVLDEVEDEKIRGGEGGVDRQSLEAAVFEKIAEEDSRYEGKSAEVAGIMSEAKNLVLAGEDPSSVAEELKSKRRSLFSEGSENED